MHYELEMFLYCAAMLTIIIVIVSIAAQYIILDDYPQVQPQMLVHSTLIHDIYY